MNWSNALKKKYRIFLCFGLLFYIIFSFSFMYFYYYEKIPEHIYLVRDREETAQVDLPVTMNLDTNSPCKEYKVTPRFFGMLDLKTVTVSVIDETEVIPSGMPVGIYLRTKGILVTGNGEILDLNGRKQEPSKNYIQSGDYIKAVNGKEIHTIQELEQSINLSKGKETDISYVRKGKSGIAKIRPILGADKKYKLGIWVKEDSQGIGTLTYITKDGRYGALGHGISDSDTEELLDAQGGILYFANIWGITPNHGKEVGGICGNITYSKENIVGKIDKNCAQGIYGQASDELIKKNKYKSYQVGLKQEVKEGKAYIISEISGKRELYEIEILKTDIASNHPNKGMTIQIVDERLLHMTNGIIQGMSGSPIIQNDKLIGAITHVFVNDYKKGYAIFIESMLTN